MWPWMEVKTLTKKQEKELRKDLDALVKAGLISATYTPAPQRKSLPKG